MEYGRLGRTDLVVSKVAFGTGSLGEFYGPLEEPTALRLVDEAIDLGVNFIDTSRYYNNAEERLGKALTPAKREQVFIATKCGRYGVDDFDFTRAGVRRGIEESLKLLRTDYVDILHMHDVEFADLAIVFGEGYGELQKIRNEGKCRYIGVTGEPIKMLRRAMTELDIDAVLTYAKGCLLDDAIATELAPIAEAEGVGLINAAAVVMGLLTPTWTLGRRGHSAPIAVQEAAARMRDLCRERGVDIAFVANQYALQRSGCTTTVVGFGTSSHLRSAIEAADSPLDDGLVAELIALRPPVSERPWFVGRPENN